MLGLDPLHILVRKTNTVYLCAPVAGQPQRITVQYWRAGGDSSASITEYPPRKALGEAGNERNQAPAALRYRSAVGPSELAYLRKIDRPRSARSAIPLWRSASPLTLTTLSRVAKHCKQPALMPDRHEMARDRVQIDGGRKIIENPVKRELRHRVLLKHRKKGIFYCSSFSAK